MRSAEEILSPSAVQAWREQWSSALDFDRVVGLIATPSTYHSFNFSLQCGLAITVQSATLRRSMIPVMVRESSSCHFAHMRAFQTWKICSQCQRQFNWSGVPLFSSEMGTTGLVDRHEDLHRDFHTGALKSAMLDVGLNELDASLLSYTLQEACVDIAVTFFGLRDRPELAQAR